MKKMLSRVLVFTLALMLSNAIVVNAYDDSDFWRNHDRSMEIVHILFESFALEDVRGVSGYPDYFGGLYIDDDGNLVLLLVVDTSFGFSQFDASLDTSFVRMGYFEGISLREVQFAFSELSHVMDMLDDIIDNAEECKAARNASRWSLDVVGNRILVNLLEFSSESIALFEANVFSSPAIVFQPCDGRVIDIWDAILELNYTSPPYAPPPALTRSVVSVRPGDHIYVWRPNLMTNPRTYTFVGSGSVGYLATNDAFGRGFVTAAHLSTALSGVHLRYGDLVGTSTDRLGRARLVWDQTVDAAFVQLYSNVVWNGTTPNGEVSQVIAPPVVGSRVQFVGSGPGHRRGTSGPITEIRASHHFSAIGLTIRNVIVWRSDASLVGGDSGGLTHSLSAAGVRGISGIIVGRVGSYGLTIQASEINSRLRLQL